MHEFARFGEASYRCTKFGALKLECCEGPAISTGRCNTGLKFLCWGLILLGLSRPLIELAGDCAQFGLAMGRLLSFHLAIR